MAGRALARVHRSNELRLNDMVPPHYVGLFDVVAGANNNAVMLPFEIWREAFINDADFALAKSSFDKLNLHPYRTFTDKIELGKQLAKMPIGKSYVNCQQDTALTHGLPWHPRLSEKLGLFRLVECPGSHGMFFSNPSRLAQAILEARTRLKRQRPDFKRSARRRRREPGR